MTVTLIDRYLEQSDPEGEVVQEVDLVLAKRRLPVVDAVYLSPTDRERAKTAQARRGPRNDYKYGRILIPPTLIIESLSKGHESHDREIKRRWYEEAGVPNYWLLDALARSLECLVLRAGEYRVDASGHGEAERRPSLFPGLVVPLGTLWAR